ncbi:MlaA family lipoprotein [Arboricoccus pini]|nr:VacJ family lipoprotein [Arboricoccus pini]
MAALLLVPSVLRAQEVQIADPIEPVNRGIFAFNTYLDGLVLRPASKAYDFVVPDVGKQGVRNVLDYLHTPVVLVNDLLQGDTDAAGNTLGRFMINTILGLGIFDVASEAGFKKHDADFGQTLGRWGAGNGIYLVLPAFGPSTLRDAGGRAVDSLVIDPIGTPFYPPGSELPWWVKLSRTATDAIDTRFRYGDTLEDLYNNSLDPYATFKTIYLQRRAAIVRGEQADATQQKSYDAIFQDDGADNGAK